ncbi:MAG TPA: acyl-CoA dehydrogenase family protein, partial [Acidimicrobiales bacterium]|nr:acyl-CoA dehydrogenase family protein [Acidimicrobiales bacterium]
MSIAISDDHVALRDTARRFTASRCTPAVVRAALDGEAGDGAPRPVPFWFELADLGWLGLAVAEADGGQGYGFAELAVVLEELGRAMAPGPALATAWAASVAPSYLTPDILRGTLAGGVDPGPALAATADRDERVLVTGTTGLLLGACNVVVLPIVVEGEECWCICDLTTEAAIVASELASLDATRRLVRYELRDVGAARLPGLTRGRVEAV